MNRIEGKAIPASNEFHKRTIINENMVNRRGLREPGSYDLSLKDEILFVEIPGDFQAIKSEDTNLARMWREITRSIFGSYFKKGYLVIAFISNMENREKCDFYVLSKHMLEEVGEFKFEG